jgi:integrase
MVTPSGGRLWRYRYEIAGKEKLLALGKYPAVGLVEARRARDEARKLLDQGRDPSVEKRLRKVEAETASATTFEKVAADWHGMVKTRWSDEHADRVRRNLQAYVFLTIGKLPVSEITARMVLKVVSDAEERSIFAARRARQQMSPVFVYAIAADLIASDPASSIRQAMRPAPEHTSHPALTDPEALQGLFLRVEQEPVNVVTKLGLRLLALTAVRTQELIGARVEEFEDLDGAEPA